MCNVLQRDFNTTMYLLLLCAHLVYGQQNFEQSWPFEHEVSVYDAVYKKVTPALFYGKSGAFKMNAFLKRRQLLGGYLRHVVQDQTQPYFQDIVKLLQQKTDLYELLSRFTPDELKKLAVISEVVYSLEPAWGYRYKAQSGFVLYHGDSSTSHQFEREFDRGYATVHRMQVAEADSKSAKKIIEKLISEKKSVL